MRPSATNLGKTYERIVHGSMQASARGSKRDHRQLTRHVDFDCGLFCMVPGEEGPSRSKSLVIETTEHGCIPRSTLASVMRGTSGGSARTQQAGRTRGSRAALGLSRATTRSIPYIPYWRSSVEGAVRNQARLKLTSHAAWNLLAKSSTVLLDHACGAEQRVDWNACRKVRHIEEMCLLREWQGVRETRAIECWVVQTDHRSQLSYGAVHDQPGEEQTRRIAGRHC